MYSSYQTAILYLAKYFADHRNDPVKQPHSPSVGKLPFIKGGIYMIHKIYGVNEGRIFSDIYKTVDILDEEQ